MADVLADIDATVDGRCACGCGELLASDVGLCPRHERDLRVVVLR